MKLIIKLIYAILELLNTHSEEKLIKSFELDGMMVSNEKGWTNATHIHLTKPFEIYELTLENGLTLKCADEHIVFTAGYKEKWVKDLTNDDYILTEYGLSKVLYVKRTGKYVNMCDITVDDENHRYYTNGILSHNTTTSAVFMLHYILFNVDKNALVLGNKRKTAVEILDKAKKIYQELPYFLRPGIYKWNEGEIVLDNGCRLMAEATTINSGISFTFHCVLADEFAHVQPNIIDKFYNNLFPTITAAKARFMITSTQNGYNLFYRLCKASEARENEYAFFKTDWYEVPEWNPEKLCWEKRDEAWHRLQVANYGSEEAFNKQFGTNFDVNTNTLIDTIILRKFEQRGFEFVRKEIPGVSHADKFFWHPHFDINEMRNNFYAITTDIAEGIGGDDTIFIFNQLFYDEKKEMVCTKTVGYFKANTLNSKEATTVLKEFCQQYLDINKYVISLEYNLYGELFAKYILENIENDPANAFRFNEDVILKYWNEEMTRYTLGKKISAKSKQLGTGMFKQAFEREEIVNESLQFLNQVSNFTDSKGNGTYAACFGHDDLVMAQLQMVFVIENPRYKELCEMFMAANSVEEKMEGYDPYSQMSMDYNNMNSWFQNGYSQEVTDFMDMYNFNQ